MLAALLSSFTLISCGEDASATPAIPPDPAKTLAELTEDERADLCAWSAQHSYEDPRVHRAACTTGALAASIAEPSLSCVELRDDCIHDPSLARFLPCFAELDAGTGACPDSLVGDHLDCGEELRTDTIEVFGKVRCDDPASYVSPASPERWQRVSNRPGCIALRDSCPTFFGPAGR